MSTRNYLFNLREDKLFGRPIDEICHLQTITTYLVFIIGLGQNNSSGQLINRSERGSWEEKEEEDGQSIIG